MKKLIALLLAAAMLLCFAGCSPSQTSGSNIPSSDINSSSENLSSGSSSSQNSSSGNSSSDKDKEHDHSSIHQTHYFYAQLDTLQQEYYEVLYSAVNNMQASWIVLGLAEEDYRTDIATVREAVLFDHPEIFWVPNNYATALGTNEKGQKTAMVYFSGGEEEGSSAYTVAKGEKERMERDLALAISKYTKAVTATDPYEIELQLHNLLCANTVYVNNPDEKMIYTAYGAIVNGRALCEGYSRAMQLLLSKFGITAIPVTGVADGEGHMWNQVLIGGNWYNLDVTWNDQSDGKISHEYFNVPDSQIVQDHTFSKNYTDLTENDVVGVLPSFNINRPACTETEFNYFVKSGFVLDKTNIQAFLAYLVQNTDETVEIAVEAEYKNEIYADAQQFINDFNRQLSREYPECGFKITGLGFSVSCIRVYKASNAARR